jgi:simple sugar transport system permease protein
MTLLEAILLTVITASTPLVIAAIGELVVERSGVVNLGLEGMMIMGAACGFAVAILTGNTFVGVLAAIGAGVGMALIFAFLTLGLVANQVASGLALTIFGLGLSGLVGASFVGAKRDAMPKLDLPVVSDIPFIGPVLFGHDPFVYTSLALVLGVWWFITRTRAGLVLRACGENLASAHALGYSVLKIRLLAIIFGGACAGLAGAYLSLAYTPFWSPGMTAGRGWIALAIVVFASWLPWRMLVGAYLFGGVTILQLHAQGMGVRIPSQVMAALPYIVTIVALVVITRGRGGRHKAPASLGMPFAPDH